MPSANNEQANQQAIAAKIPSNEIITSYFNSYNNRAPYNTEQCIVDGITYNAQVMTGVTLFAIPIGAPTNSVVTWIPNSGSKITVNNVTYTYVYNQVGMQSSAVGRTGSWLNPTDYAASQSLLSQPS